MAAPMSADTMVRILKAEGIKVREYRSWRTHERDDETGKTFGPVNYAIIHHTAGRNSRDLCYNGTSSLPGPLCHAHLAKDGTLSLLSNGRANHAGSVPSNVHNALVAERTLPAPSGPENVDGNDHGFGLEIENLGDNRDTYPAVQYDTAVRYAAAICRYYGWSAKSVAGHKEVTTRKIDPRGPVEGKGSFSMATFRKDVQKRLDSSPNDNPGPVPPVPKEDDDMTADEIYSAVWEKDAIPSPSTASTHDTNPTWKAESYLPSLWDRTTMLSEKLDKLQEQLDILVDALTTEEPPA